MQNAPVSNHVNCNLVFLMEIKTVLTRMIAYLWEGMCEIETILGK